MSGKNNVVRWKYTTPGIPDDCFVRGNIPMTKEEVRSLILAKGRIKENSIVYDVGAGTGSVSVEVALMAPRGVVYGIEKDKDALSLIRQNAALFKLDNLVAVHGEAPEAFARLPGADCMIVGGSGGRLEEILQAGWQKLKPGGRVVISAVTLETLTAGVKVLEKLGFEDLEVVSVTVAKAQPLKKYRLWKGNNPVFLISASRSDISG